MAKRILPVPPAQGYVKKGFELVLDTFRQSVENGTERGGTFAAYYKGELVVNIWAGFADEQSRRPWKENTAAIFYSCTKFLSAVVIAHLVERGLLSYNQPISTYWPEFAQNGKQNITLKQLLSLKAGLPFMSEPYKLSLLRDDPVELSRLLAKQTPWHKDETFAYSMMIISLYLDEIVQRVDLQHRRLGEYFDAEIAKPFGIDMHIGLPKSEFWRTTRQSLSTSPAEYKAYQMKQAANPAIDLNLLVNIQAQPSDFLRFTAVHDPDFIELPCGASHGVGSAAGMAKLHSILANGGMLHGRRLLSEDTIQQFHTLLSLGPERTLGQEIFYGYGMELLPILEDNVLFYNIGHGGFGGQYAATDTKYKTGWAYATNYLNLTLTNHSQTKWSTLEAALFQCIYAIEGVKATRKHIDTAQELKEILKRGRSNL